MDIDEAIANFRLGQFEIDCAKMVVRRNGPAGEIFEGPGYIKQTEDGMLVFKLYIAMFENAEPFGQWNSRAVFGTLHSEDTFYSLKALLRNGTEFSASGIRPSFNWDMQSEPRAELATGQLQSVIAKVNQPQPRHYLGMYFFDEYDVPLHVMSEAEKHGEKILTIDTAEFEACGSAFTVKVREGSGQTSIEATSEEPFPEAFHLRIRESLQYITGKTASCRARVESIDAGIILELSSPLPATSHPQFVAPISRASPGFRADTWRLFGNYLAYVSRNSQATYWHPVAYHLYNACESSANSLDAWAVGVSVAVEAVASMIPMDVNDIEAKGSEKIAALQKAMYDHLGTLT